MTSDDLQFFIEHAENGGSLPGSSAWEVMMDKDVQEYVKYTAWRRTLPVRSIWEVEKAGKVVERGTWEVPAERCMAALAAASAIVRVGMDEGCKLEGRVLGFRGLTGHGRS